MRIRAIVYTSNTGHTAKYAAILGRITGLPVYTLENATREIAKGTEIVYLGWLFASSLKGYKTAAKHFRIAAVCGVGLCDTGTMIGDVRHSISLPEEIPLFTMQGGIDKTKLKGINKFMIRMLIRAMEAKKNPTEDDLRMLELLSHDEDYVSEANTAAFCAWYEEQNTKKKETARV